MRRFEDQGGRSWDVVVGRESWGAFVALFVPVDGEGGVLQTTLRARDRGEAEEEIDALERDGLLELLERAEPKELG